MLSVVYRQRIGHIPSDFVRTPQFKGRKMQLHAAGDVHCLLEVWVRETTREEAGGILGILNGP